jgi:hypothetical protein
MLLQIRKPFFGLMGNQHDNRDAGVVSRRLELLKKASVFLLAARQIQHDAMRKLFKLETSCKVLQGLGRFTDDLNGVEDFPLSQGFLHPVRLFKIIVHE